MFVVDDGLLDTLQALDENVVHKREAGVDGLGAVLGVEVLSQVGHAPLGALLRVVAGRLLLDGHVGEVHVRVRDAVQGEACARESGESLAVQVRLQRVERRHQNIRPDVELLAADEVGVGQVALHHVDLGDGHFLIGLALLLGPRLALLPVRDVLQVRE